MRIPGYAYSRASDVLLGPKTVSVFSIRKAFTPPLPAPVSPQDTLKLALKWGCRSVCDGVGQWKLCLSPGTSSVCFTHVLLPRAWPTPCPLSRGAGPGQIGLASHLCESQAQSTSADQATARFTDVTFGRHRDADRAPLPRHSPSHGRTLIFSL